MQPLFAYPQASISPYLPYTPEGSKGFVQTRGSPCPGNSIPLGKRGLSRALAFTQPIGGLRRLGCGREDGLLVALQNAEPVLDVARMIAARFGRDAEIAAKEGRAEFGNQLFDGIGFVAEAA